MTSQERQLALDKNWYAYYQTTCHNGDVYGCAALNVATASGSFWTGGIFEELTNFNLALTMLENGVGIDEIMANMEGIRQSLPMAQVNYLDKLGATEESPKHMTRDGIGKFHEPILIDYGAEGAFGGYYLNEYHIPSILYDYCGPPACM